MHVSDDNRIRTYDPLDRPYLQMIAVGFTDKQHESQKYIPGALPAELHRHILFSMHQLINH